MDSAPTDTIAVLRERMGRMQGRPATQPVATHEALSGLLQLQTGGIYATDSASLTGLLMAGPSAEGAWCGVVGSQVWGLEALSSVGVRLERCVLVPDPRHAWLEVTAALVDVLAVVVVVPPTSTVGEQDASRIAARLRKRGGVLVVLGDWPRADARLSLGDVRWAGLDRGHGHLQARQATVEVSRGTAPARTRRLWFPDVDQTIRPVEAASGRRSGAEGRMSRILVLWAPDWPVLAAAEGVATGTPVAVLSKGQVLACSQAARAEGVRRGMRRRDAQSRCPDLVLRDHQPDADARAFEEVLTALEHLSPGVAPLRPGLCALHVPSRFYGGEVEAGAVIAERLVSLGIWDIRMGVADGLFAAEQAARRSAAQDSLIVPAGASAAFLRDLPIDVLDDGEAEASTLVSLLRRMGLTTLGAFAGLAPADVHTRFGTHGALLHRLAAGRDAQVVSRRQMPPELTATLSLEPPLDRVDQIAFSLRATAEAFVTDLADRAAVCTTVRIEVDADGSLATTRRWMHPRWFSATDLIDRVRWQLQPVGASPVGAPVDAVRLIPEVDRAAGRSLRQPLRRRPRRAGRARRRAGAGHRRPRAGRVGADAGRTQPPRAAPAGAVGREADRRSCSRVAVARRRAAARSGHRVRAAAGGLGGGRRGHVGGGHRPRCRQRGTHPVPSGGGCRLAAGRLVGRPVAGRRPLVGRGRRPPHRPLPGGRRSTAAPG